METIPAFHAITAIITYNNNCLFDCLKQSYKSNNCRAYQMRQLCSIYKIKDMVDRMRNGGEKKQKQQQSTGRWIWLRNDYYFINRTLLLSCTVFVIKYKLFDDDDWQCYRDKIIEIQWLLNHAALVH